MTDSPTAGFSGPTVCRLTGVTYRQLDYWARTNLVTPSITAANGSGSKRAYSYADVLEVKRHQVAAHLGPVAGPGPPGR